MAAATLPGSPLGTGNTATSSLPGFTLDTVAPNLVVQAVGDGKLTEAEATSGSGVIRVTADNGFTATVTLTGTAGPVTKTITAMLAGAAIARGSQK